MGIKVELPAGEARRLLEEWRNRAAQMEGELTQLEAAIASTEAQLEGKLPSDQSSKTKDPARSAPLKMEGEKRRKGENLRILQNYLKSVGQKGATVAEISKNTSVGISSVIAVFKRHTEIFVKGNDGLWRAK